LVWPREIQFICLVRLVPDLERCQPGAVTPGEIGGERCVVGRVARRPRVGLAEPRGRALVQHRCGCRGGPAWRAIYGRDHPDARSCRVGHEPTGAGASPPWQGVPRHPRGSLPEARLAPDRMSYAATEWLPWDWLTALRQAHSLRPAIS